MSRKRIVQMLVVAIALVVSAIPQGKTLAGQIIDPTPISYVYDVGAPSPTDHTDSTGSELCDGILAPAVGGFDPTYIGYQDKDADDGVPQPQVTFNLGDVFSLESLSVFYGVYPAAGIHAPDSIGVSLSTDGINFGNEITFSDFDDSDTAAVVSRELVANIGDLEASYVRVSFVNDTEWTFLSEVQFVETSDVPEPSMTLLLVGMVVSLLGMVRRRKVR